MRTGLVGEVASSREERELVDSVAALMRVFVRDAVEVAGRYTVGHARREVTADDMRRALMYCARTFFEHDDVEARVRRERREMEDEDEDEDEGEDEDEKDEGEDGNAEGDEVEAASPRTLALVRHVDAIVDVWHLWTPDDPVHQLVKRAIDNVPTECDEE